MRYATIDLDNGDLDRGKLLPETLVAHNTGRHEDDEP